MRGRSEHFSLWVCPCWLWVMWPSSGPSRTKQTKVSGVTGDPDQISPQALTPDICSPQGSSDDPFLLSFRYLTSPGFVPRVGGEGGMSVDFQTPFKLNSFKLNSSVTNEKQQPDLYYTWKIPSGLHWKAFQVSTQWAPRCWDSTSSQH